MTAARVTVCIPSHRPAMLAEAIASVHAQTVPTNLLVSASDDWWPHKLNALIEIATTEFVVVLCDDDHLQPTYVAETLAAADATGAQLVYTDYEFFGDHHDIKSAGAFTVEALLQHNTLLAWTALVHAPTLRRLGNFDPSLAYQDWDMWLRMAHANVRATHLARALVRYRKWDGCGGYQIPYADARHAVLAKHAQCAPAIQPYTTA